MPSGIDEVRACESEKVAEDSAKTRSNNGNMVTPSPEISPLTLAIIVFGKAASVMRKLLKNKFY